MSWPILFNFQGAMIVMSVSLMMMQRIHLGRKLRAKIDPLRSSATFHEEQQQQKNPVCAYDIHTPSNNVFQIYSV